MDANSLTSVAELIDALGGNSAVAKQIGKQPSTVSEMKRAGRISVRYWDALLVSARGKVNGLEYRHLVKLHAPTKHGVPA